MRLICNSPVNSIPCVLTKNNKSGRSVSKMVVKFCSSTPRKYFKTKFLRFCLDSFTGFPYIEFDNYEHELEIVSLIEFTKGGNDNWAINYL